MKALLLTLLLLAGAARGFAQRIAVRHSLATVDGQPYARIESDGGLAALGQRTFYVSSPQGERRLVVKELHYNDPAEASPDNPAGIVRYVQLLFPATRTVAELPMSGLGFERPLDIARTLYVARLLRGPLLDAPAVADFVALNGTPFSARRQLLNQALLVRSASY